MEEWQHSLVDGLQSITHIIEDLNREISYKNQLEISPFNLLKPVPYIDGNQFCFLFGENIQTGFAGFGPTPTEAMNDFNKNANALFGK